MEEQCDCEVCVSSGKFGRRECEEGKKLTYMCNRYTMGMSAQVPVV